MGFYRLKPAVVEAVQFTGEVDSFKEVLNFIGVIPTVTLGYDTEYVYIKIPTRNGSICVSNGDYIYRGSTGDFAVRGGDYFENKYEEIKGEDSVQINHFTTTMTYNGMGDISND